MPSYVSFETLHSNYTKNQCTVQTRNSILKPATISLSVELGNSIPRYQARTGVGAPSAVHCRVVDWPTASDTSRYGPDEIDGASANIINTHRF